MTRPRDGLLVVVLLAAVGCGGGGGGGGVPSSSTPNTETLIVDGGPTNDSANEPFVTVTVCVPGSSSSCTTVDHMLVDTGSTGVRIVSSALQGLSLPGEQDGSGRPIGECAQFVDGYSWGPVASADVGFASDTAAGLAVQVIGDPSFAAVPDDCSAGLPSENTVEDFGANGVVGIGFFAQDCGPACTGGQQGGNYYACPANGCEAIARALPDQLQNPVLALGANTNGILIELPALSSPSAATVTGTLTFGIGTEDDNALGDAAVLTVDGEGDFSASFDGQLWPTSYIDSGSNANFFDDPALPSCRVSTGFYCPGSRFTSPVENRGLNGTATSETVTVDDADQLLDQHPTDSVFPTIAGPSGDATTFDWGLPFFLGRRVFVAIEGQAAPGAPTPYVAYR